MKEAVKVKSSLAEFLEELAALGIKISLRDGKLRLRGRQELFTPELIEEARKHREALKLLAEKGTVVGLCFGCGSKEAEFIPTPEVLGPFRKWLCLECGWGVWRRESGELSTEIMRVVLQTFPKSFVVRYEVPGLKKAGKP